ARAAFGGRSSDVRFLLRRIVELDARVDIAKRIGLIIERHFGHRERRVPSVDLASAAVEKAREMRQYVALHEREYRMRLVERLGDGKLQIGRAARREREETSVVDPTARGT